MEQPSEWSFLFVVFHVAKQGYAKKQNFVKIIENRQNIHNFKLRYRIIFNKSKISNTSPTKNCVLPKPRYEFNVGPETEVDSMATNVENVPYATILLPPLFLPLFHHSHHIFR